MPTAKITAPHIARIAGELPQWQIVAPELGFGAQEIKDIETKHPALDEQRTAVLRIWIERKGKAATYEALSKVLEELGQGGAAERIRKIASEQ